MLKSITDTHDIFFRETFSRREVAEDVLREYIPAGLVRGIDWSMPEIAKDSFVGKALRKHFSDLCATYASGRSQSFCCSNTIAIPRAG